ncbi:MAG: transmembrane sensor [Kangiellaceae bacterium]
MEIMTNKSSEFMSNEASKNQINHIAKDAPQAQARQWLTELYAGHSDPNKREEFVLWINSSESNRHAFRHSLQVWKTIGMTDSAMDWLDQQVHQNTVIPLISRRKFKHRLGKSQMWLSGIAASLVLIAVSAIFHSPNNFVIRPSAIAFTSPIGQNRTITLSDGSTVTLAGNSSILVDISQDTRYISLQKGGAYFDVSHDPSRIFSVTAEHLQVRVRGTAFAVKHSADNVIKVSVQRGLVDVADLSEQGVADEQVLQLRANQQVRADLNGRFITPVTQFNNDTEFSWLSGRLIYDDIPLKTVVMDINRYAKKPVVILDESLNELAITASFTFNQIDQALDGLAAAYPIILTEEGERKVLTKQ